MRRHCALAALFASLLLFGGVVGCDKADRNKALAVAPPAAGQAAAPARAFAPDEDPDVMVVKTELIKFEMVKIPGGEISIPAVDDKGKITKDAPPVKVVIKPFWMSKTEIPWEAYDVFFLQQDLNEQQKSILKVRDEPLPKAARSRPTKPTGDPDKGSGHAGFPTIRVHPHAAQMYCKWLAQRTRGKYRLPTEAEWEWAASAGGKTMTPDIAQVDKMAWHSGNALNDEGALATHEVGQKVANPFGLLDMFGNVWEWCECLNDARTPVARGGCYKDKPSALSVRSRTLYRSDWQTQDCQDPKSAWWLSDGPDVGFRIVREDE